MRSLSKLNPYWSIGALVLDWASIVAIVVVTELHFSWPLYLAAVVLLGGRLHALAVMLHEATHYRLLRHHAWNDWVGEVFAAWPILVTLEGYRCNHFSHHRHTNTPRDPDWQRKLTDPYFAYPKRRRDIVLDLVKSMIGLRFLVDVQNVVKSKELNTMRRQLQYLRNAFYIGLIVSSVAFGFYTQLLLYWIVPVTTSLIVFLLVRSISEHHGGGMDYSSPLTASRHVKANWFSKLFFPHNINYHLAHHLYPSVPFHNLPRMHEHLMSVSTYRHGAHITDGYLDVLFKESVPHSESRSAAPS